MPPFPGYVKPSRQPHHTCVSNSHPSNANPSNADFNHQQASAEKIQKLRSQLKRIEQRHRSELSQLEETWRRELAATVAAQPAQQKQIQNRRLKPNLNHISTTYVVPRRLRPGWLDRALSTVPRFLSLVVAGIMLAALTAIALSPEVLWASLSPLIQSAIPFIFVTGLLGVFITAVWDTAR
ncbi:MAG: hypothetical protein AAFQ74_00195 [Cyanobacteria bacterium J06623_4]